MARPKKEIDISEEMFNINGLSVKKKATYRIENRYDATAPSGFKGHNSTKIPSSSVGNSIQLPYSDNSWDTGFHEYSPCYRGELESKVKERVNALQKYVVEPYERQSGKKDVLSHTNDTFWSEFIVPLGMNMRYSTENPEDVLKLYVAMQAGQLCPEDRQGDPKYIQADYVIIDQVDQRSVKQKKAVSEIDAIGKFFTLLSENKPKLISALRYTGLVNVTDTINVDTLKTSFQTWLRTNDKNAEAFDVLTDRLDEDKKFEEEVYLFSTLKRAYELSRLSKNSVGDFVYNGIPFGKELKTAASNLMKNPDFSEIKAQIIEEFAK